MLTYNATSSLQIHTGCCGACLTDGLDSFVSPMNPASFNAPGKHKEGKHMEMLQ